MYIPTIQVTYTLHIYHKLEIRGLAFVECCIRGFSCRYFFSRSCSISACPKLVLGTCINGATSTIRNSQLNPQQPQQMHAPLFRRDIHISKISASIYTRNLSLYAFKNSYLKSSLSNFASNLFK